MSINNLYHYNKIGETCGKAQKYNGYQEIGCYNRLCKCQTRESKIELITEEINKLNQEIGALGKTLGAEIKRKQEAIKRYDAYLSVFYRQRN